MPAAARHAHLAFILACIIMESGCALLTRHSSLPAPNLKTNDTQNKPLRGVIVILDPGHGGEDSGAVCSTASEAALTYRMAAETARCLREQGASVVFTVRSATLSPVQATTEPPVTLPRDAVMVSTGLPLRSRHSSLPLWQRAALARYLWKIQLKTDSHAARDVFFISLHYDDFSVSGVSGSIVCVDRREQRIPRLAVQIAEDLNSGHWNRRCNYRGLTGVSGRRLGVLDPKYNPVPEKILLEVATLSNPQDALQASDPVWRWEMAKRITRSVIGAHEQ